MIDVIEITIEEFENDIYDKYIELFPEEEQREWNKIVKTSKKGIEKFYKIIYENKTIGFFLLEKINDDYPFYIDYFSIYREYQNQGYGTKAIKVLLSKIINKKGLIAEIETESKDNPITIKRFEFYKRLGFKKIKSEYLLYNVYFTPILYNDYKEINKEKYDKIFFDYYAINCGENEVKRHCKIIK
ncbi:MAG: GNAT family N-acetyltransferase [Clostridia bacterium]|nr:GNAT family N-acetyltransferase [Clostridia bacterium]